MNLPSSWIKMIKEEHFLNGIEAAKKWCAYYGSTVVELWWAIAHWVFSEYTKWYNSQTHKLFAAYSRALCLDYSNISGICTDNKLTLSFDYFRFLIEDFRVTKKSF